MSNTEHTPKADGRFKKGRPAHEARGYVPIGSLRIAKGAYLEQKISDDQSLSPKRRWVPVHRMVWEAANGPVPVGNIVRFKKGMATTDLASITTDKLECLTRAESMRRNSYQENLPPELRSLIQLRGHLNRQIRERVKEEPHV